MGGQSSVEGQGCGTTWEGTIQFGSRVWDHVEGLSSVEGCGIEFEGGGIKLDDTEGLTDTIEFGGGGRKLDDMEGMTDTIEFGRRVWDHVVWDGIGEPCCELSLCISWEDCLLEFFISSTFSRTTNHVMWSSPHSESTHTHSEEQGARFIAQ